AMEICLDVTEILTTLLPALAQSLKEIVNEDYGEIDVCHFAEDEIAYKDLPGTSDEKQFREAMREELR
ncbi:hypothetical protein SARC_14207, partial [Sphaeroforma arctica JP610]